MMFSSRTENNMKTRSSSESKVLDFFSKVGSSRGVDLSAKFLAALSENENLAVRALLWCRDVRGGAGEREQFRNLIKTLEKNNVFVSANIMHKIPEIGRWDDLFAYVDPVNRSQAFGMIREALEDGNSLAAKWMPRKGPVSIELRNFLGWTPKKYRKTLVNLTNVVETKMCAKDWDNINFSHVPSLAAARYQKAFDRNAHVKYADYICGLKNDSYNDKINSSAVYPYDVIKSVLKGVVDVAEAQWNSLPNYVGDVKMLPIVDVSGSMYQDIIKTRKLRSIDVAISLALYLSEKNASSFKDMFITFSENPELLFLKGSLLERCNQMKNSRWGLNTNLHKAFDKVLDVAKNNNVSQKDMPDYIIILSDMQFDICTKYDDSVQEMIHRKYNESGYEVPKIVYWDLNDYSNTPVRFDDRDICHISGFNPSIMKSVLSQNISDYTPMNVMKETLMNERYDY